LGYEIKIVFVTTDLSTGGAEMMLLKVLERLAPRFSAHVISLTSLGEIAPLIVALKVPVESLGMRSGISSVLGFIRLARRLKALKPDVVQTWMYHADLLGGLAAWATNVPTVAWAIRNGNFDRDRTKLSTRAVVGMCATISHWIPDGILNCSDVARRVHEDAGYAKRKMIVIPNGFDISRFQPNLEARRKIRAELGLADKTPIVGLIGRFDTQKNHIGFFEAASILHRRMPEVRFVLAGKGVDEANHRLMRILEMARVRHVTTVLGLRSDVPCLMAALDVLASSSLGEAFSNVLGEAMACGVPCAVTDVGDSAYIVGETGRVVPSGDMRGLALALEDLLNLSLIEKTKLADSARARVAECFEIGKVVRQYEAFYGQLTATRLRKQKQCVD
jgi:glycosyltransferase involved in cell wall biosynthesis